MARLKILQILDEVGGHGGVAVYSVTMEETLRSLGHSVVTAATSRLRLSRAPREIISSPRMYGSRQDEDGSWDVGKFLASLPWSPDVILAHQPPFPRVASDLSKMAPLVIFQHMYLCHPGHLFRDRDQVCTRRVGMGCIPRWYGRRCGTEKNPMAVVDMIGRAGRDRDSLSRAARVVANSHYLAGQLKREGVAGEKIQVVYPGCSVLILDPSPAKSGRSPHPTASFAGRIVYAKGLNNLIDAIEGLNALLDIAGDGWNFEAAKKGVATDVRLLGHLTHSEVCELFQSSWVSAMPSLWPEPFGMAGIEALASGTPVVAFDVGGIPEWLSPDVGSLVSSEKTGRTERLRAALANYLEVPPSDEVAERCRNHAETLCGMAAFGQSLENLFENFQ